MPSTITQPSVSRSSRSSRSTIAAVARLITENQRQLDLEARILDPSGRGQCCKQTCRACAAETFGRRSTFEEVPECHVCGSSDVEIAEASYPRHTEETLRIHVAQEFGDRGRFLFAAAQAYLRRRHAPRRMRREGSRSRCRSRSHRPTVKARDGDGDGDGEPPGDARTRLRSVALIEAAPVGGGL